jgi:hypothetical protein
VVLPLIKLTPSAGIPFTVKSLAWTVAGSTEQLRLISKVDGGVKVVMPQGGLVTEQAAAVEVGVGVGVGAPDWAQYLPPVLKTLRLLLVPPQTIISLPVHTAACQ